MLDLQSRLKLEGGDILFELTREQVEKSYNGIGSASMPNIIRWTLTELNPSFVLPAVIHDCMWDYFCDGSDDDFFASNEAFENNCNTCINEFYAIYNPARYFYRLNASKYKYLLDHFGKGAYLAATKKAVENPPPM